MINTQNVGGNKRWLNTSRVQLINNQVIKIRVARKDKNDPDHGRIRKLSMTCQLTDGSEYKGGELEFDFRNYDPHMRDELKHRVQCKEILPKGSIIVFPSFVWHRVKPVTSGTRYSLVVWHLGRPFK